MSASLPAETAPACCHKTVSRSEAGFCPECGQPAIRCMAHSECGSLLNSRDRCEVCVWPELILDAGAMVDARRGGVMSLPLTVTNQSPVGLPLFVTAIHVREGLGEWKHQPQSWERLDSRQSAPAVVRAEDLSSIGAHRIEILLLVATRWRWREERFAFSAGLTLTVSEPDPEGGHNVRIQGDTVGPTTVYISDRSTRNAEAANAQSQPVELVLTRADTCEREFRLRGHENGLLTPRSVRLAFRGFAENEAPPAGLIAGEGGFWRAGRDRTHAQGGTGNIRLLARGPDGTVDEALSRAISRHHFDIYVESGRLMLRVQGQHGLKVNDRACRRGECVEINDGDLIHPVARRPSALSIRADFSVEHGSTESVMLTALAPQASGA